MTSISPNFLTINNEAAALIRAFNWGSTALGPIASWPQSLKTVVGAIVHSNVPLVVLWGADGYLIYNDAYATFAGRRHPRLLGCKVREGWPEVADFNDRVLKVGLAGGTSAFKDQKLTLHRDGKPESLWMNLDYSPIIDESGQPAGVIAIVIETTQRVLADRHNAAERERLHAMFAQAPNFMAMLEGPDHITTLANHAYLELIGRDNVVGKPVRESLPEITDQGFLEILDDCYRTGEPFIAKGAKMHLQRAGQVAEERLLDFVYQPIKSGRGDVVGIFLEGADVTDRIRSERAVLEREADWRALNDDLERKVVERLHERGLTWQLTPDLQGVLTSEGYFESSNPAWQVVLGWTAAELAKIPIFDLIHPDDVAKSRAGFARLVNQGKSISRAENRYRRKDGSYRWLSWASVSDENKLYCSARDVTGQKEQEIALAAVRSERDRLWRNSPDLLMVMRADGEVRAVSPACTTLLGLTPAELAGRDFLDLIHPEDRESSRGALAQALSRDGLSSFENRYQHSDGTYRWFSWAAAQHEDLVYATGRHISVEKEIAAKLASAQDALRQSQKLESMGQLTGGVAHDFNNLLTPILGTLDMLIRRGVGGERERRHIDGAFQAAERAKTLVQRLLAFARRQPLQSSAVDVTQLVHGMAGIIGSTIGPQIKIVVALGAGLPRAMADPNQLENALLNLCVNARDAMEHGGTLRISAASESVGPDHRTRLAPGHYIYLSVADTGVGMSDATLARAIEPFFSTKGIGKGTGLGLSMVHGLASQLGGALTIKSEIGLGTNVEFWLPASMPLAENTGTVPSSSTPIGSGTALLVDDEELVRASAAEMLRELGYDVIEASSAEQAIRFLDEGLRPQILVTDHLMPGMTGAELARELRRRQPGMPVLIVSGYIDLEDIASDLPRITKPFRLLDLATALAKEVFGDRHAATT